MTAPQTGASYRLQLHPGFGFSAAADLIPYLSRLGVERVYTSPIVEAVAGSSHGYDVTDPTQLRSELGGAPGFARLLDALRQAHVALVVDIVPNHMAADPQGPWWWDVLENGPSSEHAASFDIAWYRGGDGTSATVLVPILGDHYGRVLEGGGITVERDAGRFTVRCADHLLPISPSTLDDLLAPAARAAGSAELAALADEFGALPDARHTEPQPVAERARRRRELAEQLTALAAADASIARAIDDELERTNADPDRLDALLRRQNYRLARWRTANEEVDYRRFFTIESLVGLRTEDPDVFDAAHALVLDLVHDGSIDALRVDHVDGLRDPTAYLERLTGACSVPVVVEKILHGAEDLPPWPVAGTTGYEFLARVNQLFVAGDHEDAMTEAYVEATGEAADFATVVRGAKHQVMARELVAEVERACDLLAQVCERHRRHRDHTARELRTALTELTACLDVYRTYRQAGAPARPDDVAVLEQASARAGAHRPDIDRELLGFLVDLLAGRTGDGPYADELTARWQQLTGPVMAKGVEDTAFYRYHRLISLCEVGDDPGVFGRGVDEFHAATARAAQRWPGSMLALSTHDTKRSADVRARITVLAEEPEAWRRAVARWTEHNDRAWAGEEPDRATEYLLYQTLVGAWPLPVERLTPFLEKAVREAKVHTTWTDPDPAYEARIARFAQVILADAAFVGQLEELLATTDLVRRGRRASLAQVVLHLTSPGQPDLYQGSERWDLSLADPDNRRPLDVAAAEDELAAAAARRCSGFDQVLAGQAEGAKLWLTHRLLQLRTERPDLFAEPGYEPLPIVGHRDEVLAFRRGDLVVVASCRSRPPSGSPALDLPTGRWRDVLGTGLIDGGPGVVPDLLAGRPAAVLVRDRP